jgi:hypothetical protein
VRLSWIQACSSPRRTTQAPTQRLQLIVHGLGPRDLCEPEQTGQVFPANCLRSWLGRQPLKDYPETMPNR